MKELDLGDLGLDAGGELLVKRALRELGVGEPLVVRGRAPELTRHLQAFCRTSGHSFSVASGNSAGIVTLVDALDARHAGAERAGTPDSVVEEARASWGLAARGATVEAGGPEFDFPWHRRVDIWADEASRLYAQAAAKQWDPSTAIPWDTPFDTSPEIENAVVQVMTYLAENETAALIIPARFASLIHPHFREVMQLLAIQAADEARHIEIFTRRALLKQGPGNRGLGLSTVGGQASLKTLIDEPDFALASFLLSVLGEGSFLSLLWFLRDHAPDPVTRRVAELAAQDEARHVAFGLAHLRRHVGEDPGLLAQLRTAIERRHDALAQTSGLNEEVFDALVLLAAGSFEPRAIAEGWRKVQELTLAMHTGRRERLERLGFGAREADELSSLHTRNFM